MSAHEIPAGSLYAAFAVTGGLAWLAGGRRRGAGAIAGGLAAVQTTLHVIFSAGRSHGGGAGGHAAMDHGAMGEAAMDHAAMTHAAMDPAMAPAATVDPAAMDPATVDPTALDSAMEMLTTAAGSSSSLGMLAAHLLAALVCGLWLARGEAALFALARTVGTFVFTPLRLLLAVVRVPEPPQAVRPRPHSRRRLHGVVLAHTLSRRGPPRLSVPRATALGAHV
ncbi:hypothetical protein Q5762_06795 [Streptomyces sp. P9(2023)]|uniref:hypothetical protein n=1 Tax=Streptomyces sp. P9(2023) TaxID=3064394 RepID=UPI0028F426B1|nr:hypothetical protein [Streptomyces sp. P9(2023)]MDT9688062.1 hypothetical protein [Streptomyces sp. P9(2023)]